MARTLSHPDNTLMSRHDVNCIYLVLLGLLSSSKHILISTFCHTVDNVIESAHAPPSPLPPNNLDVAFMEDDSMRDLTSKRIMTNAEIEAELYASSDDSDSD